MRDELLRHIACEDDGFRLGVVLESLDDVGEAAQCILDPDIDIRIWVIEGYL